MRATLLLLCCSLFACRTSGLGACNKDSDCPANSVCSSNGQVCIAAACSPVCGSGQVCSHGACVASGGPAITGIAVTTPARPDFTNSATGRGYYAGAPTVTTPLTITATITASAGIDTSTVCLRVTGETGACAHPGTAGASNTYTFGLPRPSAPMDGTTPLTFTITAADSLYATSSGSAQAGHITTTDPQLVYFDNTPPTIVVASDATPYARTGGAITVNATITDTTGVVSPQLVSGTNHVSPSNVTGSTYSFPLNPMDGPAGVEGTYSFSVQAQDGVGNQRSSSGSRVIDDAPPTLAVQIYKDVPDGGIVTYPAAVPGTGWDGTQFVYTDTVHVKGSLTDLSGVSNASLHIDGIPIAATDGGVTPGMPFSLGCSGASPCSFDVTVALNSPDGGAFNSRTSMHQMGDINAPSDKLLLVIDATDSSHGASGASVPHSGTTSNGVQTTRLLWQMYLPTAVTGLGLHPDGDLVVTLDGGVDTVYAMSSDDGGTRWSWGSDAGTNGIGPILGTPAIGSGDASSARIYVAGAGGSIYALDRDAGVVWHRSTVDTKGVPETFDVGPAVATATGPLDVVIVPGATANSSVHAVTSATAESHQPVSDADLASAPMVLNLAAYYGTQTTLTMHTLSAAGALGAFTNYTNATGLVYLDVITDGTSVFAWRLPSNGHNLLSTSPNLTFQWFLTLTPSAPPVVAHGGSLVLPLAGGQIDSVTVSTTSGSAAQLGTATLTNDGRGVLVGWDGQLGAHQHFYFTGNSAVSYAYDSAGNLSWMAHPNGATYRAFTMDCSGRLFGATNGLTGGQSLVYALITDDTGLANTPWPSYRLDSRNTGNAASTSGMRISAGGGCTQ